MTAKSVIDDIREARIGHNNPPTPFEESRVEIDDLFEEAFHWLDERGVKEQAEADKVGKLIKDMREAKSLADTRRKEENEPFDTGKTEVQARYNPILKKAGLAIETAKKALAPFLQAQETARLAQATKARQDAEEAERVAREAMRASSASDEANLADRAQAERAVEHAKDLAREAAALENARTQVKTGGRALGLRTYYDTAVTDAKAFAGYLWMTNPEAFGEFLHDEAAKIVAMGNHKLPGVTVTERKVPV